MSSVVLLVGAGALGSRYLQGLAKLGVAVRVVEPDAAAADVARQRYAEVGGDPGALVFAPAIEGTADLAIVATGSGPRRAVVERLLADPPGALLLEKFLFPAEEDYAAVGEALARAGVRTVVNTPRRRWGLYRGLAAHPALAEGFALEATGTGWGLCCNAVHFVDAFAFLTGALPEGYRAALDPAVVPAKRAGYVEMFGEVRVRGGRSSLRLACAPGDVKLEVAITIHGVRHVISERDGAVPGLGIAAGAPPTQSADTPDVVRALLAGGDAGLPSYATSAELHRPLLGLFLDHYRRHVDADARSCPIT